MIGVDETRALFDRRNEESTEHFRNKETLREYLDVAIGRALLGEPTRTMREAARQLGCSRSLVFYVERSALAKLGAFVRLSEE